MDLLLKIFNEKNKEFVKETFFHEKTYKKSSDHMNKRLK